MAKYRLKSAHYITGDKLLLGDTEFSHLGDERGTVVGDGTEHVIKWPTMEMEPLDDEARSMIEREQKRLESNAATMNPIESLPMDSLEQEYIPGFNTRRRPAKPDGASVKGG